MIYPSSEGAPIQSYGVPQDILWSPRSDTSVVRVVRERDVSLDIRYRTDITSSVCVYFGVPGQKCSIASGSKLRLPSRVYWCFGAWSSALYQKNN